MNLLYLQKFWKSKKESNNNRSNKSSNSRKEKNFELKVDSEKKESKILIRNKKLIIQKFQKVIQQLIPETKNFIKIKQDKWRWIFQKRH